MVWRRAVLLLGLTVGLFVGAAPVAHAEQAATVAAAAPGYAAHGSRTLSHETVVAAPQAEIWRLWSTSEGLSSWVAPIAAIDLRIGGIWEASYDPAGRLGDPNNIRNRVLAFAPGRMLAIAIDGAPANFPHADQAKELWTIIELEPVDETHTRVRVTMLGFGEGGGFDALYAFFDRGNAFTLQQLARRVSGDAR